MKKLVLSVYIPVLSVAVFFLVSLVFFLGWNALTRESWHISYSESVAILCVMGMFYTRENISIKRRDGVK